MKTLSRALYALGTLAVLALTAAALLRVAWVPFPGAMLPAALGELAVQWLALGTLPMAFAAWLLRRYGRVDLRRQGLIWLPVLPCALCALYGAAALVIALAKFVLHTA